MGSIFILLGSIGAGLAGIIGQLTTFRDKTNHVTRRARLVLTTVILSTALTLVGRGIADRSAATAAQLRQESLLRSIWEQRNVFSASDLSVRITYRPVDEPLYPFPKIFDENWDLTIRAVPHTSPPHVPWNEWRSTPILDGKSLDAVANRQAIDVKWWSNTGGSYVSQFSTFSDFSGDAAAFKQVTDFNSAFVELHLVARSPLSGRSIAQSLASPDAASFQEDIDKRLFHEYRIEARPDFSITALPVSADAEVFIGAQRLATMTGTLARVREWDEDVGDRVIVKFPIVKIAPSRFQVFSSNAPHGATSSATDTVLAALGMTITLALVVAVMWMLLTPNLPANAGPAAA